MEYFSVNSEASRERGRHTLNVRFTRKGPGMHVISSSDAIPVKVFLMRNFSEKTDLRVANLSVVCNIVLIERICLISFVRDEERKNKDRSVFETAFYVDT